MHGESLQRHGRNDTKKGVFSLQTVSRWEKAGQEATETHESQEMCGDE